MATQRLSWSNSITSWLQKYSIPVHQFSITLISNVEKR